MLREGAHASFVGAEDEGREVGDRCLVLSMERHYSHIRWVTGANSGQYAAVLNADLVADLQPRRFEDEFTFEALPNRMVSVACLDVMEAKGPAALLRALTLEGHLQLGEAAQQAMAIFREALRSDPAWAEIQDDLGDRGLQFERFAASYFITAALDDGSGDGQD